MWFVKSRLGVAGVFGPAAGAATLEKQLGTLGALYLSQGQAHMKP